MSRAALSMIGLTALLVAGGCDSDGRGRESGSDSVLRLEIRVTDGDAVREATMDCGGDPSSTGFISHDVYLHAACQTALANDYAREFLREDTFPKALDKSCADLSEGDEYEGRRVTFAGEFGGDPVDAELHVTDTCEQELWRYLLPLTEPRRQGVVVADNHVQLSEE